MSALSVQGLQLLSPPPALRWRPRPAPPPAAPGPTHPAAHPLHPAQWPGSRPAAAPARPRRAAPPSAPAGRSGRAGGRRTPLQIPHRADAQLGAGNKAAGARDATGPPFLPPLLSAGHKGGRKGGRTGRLWRPGEVSGPCRAAAPTCSRPGVATKRSTPPASSLRCVRSGCPPVAARLRNGRPRASARHTRTTWAHSSGGRGVGREGGHVCMSSPLLA